MLAPKFTKAQTKVAETPTSTLAPQRLALMGHRPGHDPGAGTSCPTHDRKSSTAADPGAAGLESTGNDSRGYNKQGADPASLAARGATSGVWWDFSKIPLFPPDRANRPQELVQFAAPPLPNAIQRKFAVGASNDPLEREADRIAEQSARMFGRQVRGVVSPITSVERGLLDGKEVTRGVAPIVKAVLATPGQPLTGEIRRAMEFRFGRDFSAVRVHADAQAAESARAVDACAYTAGHAMVFGQGQYRPGTMDGERLIAHELAHVVQQEHASQSQTGFFLQRKPVGGHPECIAPSPPAGAAEAVSFAEGISELRGDTRWVLRLWDFVKDEATLTTAHVMAIDAFFAAANLRISQEGIIHGWSVVSIVGHASPEGEEGYNADLALQRAEAVAGAIGAETVATSGEACGEGAPREEYPYFRAVDLTIEFPTQSVPPAVVIPDVDEERDKSPSASVDVNKAISSGNIANFAFSVNVERSFGTQLKELQPKIQAELNLLRPAAEQLFMDDPTKPVYGIVHVKMPKHETSEYSESSLREQDPGNVSLAEPVKLAREAVNVSYETRESLLGFGASSITVIEQHDIRSVEFKVDPASK